MSNVLIAIDGLILALQMSLPPTARDALWQLGQALATLAPEQQAALETSTDLGKQVSLTIDWMTKQNLLPRELIMFKRRDIVADLFVHALSICS